MKYFKSLALAGATVFALAACNKEDIRPTTAGAIKKPHASGSEKSTNYVWALGSDQRVYRWNGTSWDEPNAAARMYRISVSQDGSGAVWAIGGSNRIYKWNGTSWDEPNPSKVLSVVSAYSATVAWGVAITGTPFLTTDGGLNWTAISTTGLPASGILNVSVSSQYYAVAIGTDFRVYDYDPNSSSWSAVSAPATKVFSLSSVTTTGGAIGSSYWYVTADNTGGSAFKVFRGPVETAVTPTANMYMLAASLPTLGASKVWAIGYDNRVYRWNGTSWDEPNTAARLASISSGWH